MDIDRAASDTAEMRALLGLSDPAGGDGVNLFLVYQLRDAGTTIGGISAGVPGPYGVHGTGVSGVIVRTDLLWDFPTFIGDIAAHEVGHFLGLYHSTEADGSRHDTIPDTLECPTSCDTDGNGILEWDECADDPGAASECRGNAENLMFWATGAPNRHLTPDQGFVLLRSPFVH